MAQPIMPEEHNPNRLIIFTNEPGDAASYEAQGWTLSDMLVMKFHPGLNPDLLHPKLYGLRFWRPEPPKQGELL
jgi:hypothetical protein